MRLQANVTTSSVDSRWRMADGLRMIVALSCYRHGVFPECQATVNNYYDTESLHVVGHRQIDAGHRYDVTTEWLAKLLVYKQAVPVFASAQKYSTILVKCYMCPNNNVTTSAVAVLGFSLGGGHWGGDTFSWGHTLILSCWTIGYVIAYIKL